MTPQQLLALFERISEAPDAIPRLRQYILELAVRGRLVEQNPADTPASDTLTQLVKRHSGKATVCVSGPTSPSLPFEIPKHWVWIGLNALGVLSGGMTPSKNRSEYWNGDVNWFSPKDIKSDELVESELKITRLGVAETGLQVYPVGCLFIVGRSGILKRTFPVAINTVPATANQDLKILRPFLDGMQRFLQIMFRGMTRFILSALVKTGTTVQSLKYDEFEAQLFPLPPLEEQHRIVAKVNELMVLCDRLETSQADREARRDGLAAATLHHLNYGANPKAFLEHAHFYINHVPRLTTRPEQIKQLRQTIRNLAVRGKLVDQDVRDEPASEPMSRVYPEQTSAERLGARKREFPIQEDEAPFAVPSAWTWSRIGTCTSSIDYGTSVKSEDTSDGVPVLTMGNIQDGQVILTGRKKVPRDIDDLPQLFLRNFDILYNRTNSAELVGKTGIFLGEDDYYTFASYLLRLRVIKSLADPLYVNLAMNAPFFRETQIVPQLQQQCGQANVNGSKLRNMVIPIPPLAEQHRIVAKVDELMAICDQLETQLTVAQTERRRLLEAVLQEALSSAATQTA